MNDVAVRLPTSFDEICNEISRFTSLPENEVKSRIWREALETGWNVMQDAKDFHVTPHVYNDRMQQLYAEGYGYIFDSLVYWALPSRQRWIQHAANRMESYCERTGVRREDLRILMLGDGPGNDSLFLVSRGFSVTYFDVPGSRTFCFAVNRFQHYGLPGRQLQIVDNYRECLARDYDVVVSFEVLEHLPDPVQAIRDISTMLKVGGIALITEDLGDINNRLPTHLRVGSRYVGTAPFLFLKHRMVLSWYSRELPFKPMEFEKVERVRMAHRWQLWRDFRVRGAYLGRYVSVATRRLNKLPYLGG